MKTTLDLPDDLMREMKIRAASQGRKLKDVVADTLRSGLTKDAPVKTLKISIPAAGGLPYFECDPPSKARPSSEEVRRIIDQSQLEEDFQRAGISL